jgi:hypothetical protein
MRVPQRPPTVSHKEYTMDTNKYIRGCGENTCCSNSEAKGHKELPCGTAIALAHAVGNWVMCHGNFCRRQDFLCDLSSPFYLEQRINNRFSFLSSKFPCVRCGPFPLSGTGRVPRYAGTFVALKYFKLKHYPIYVKHQKYSILLNN